VAIPGFSDRRYRIFHPPESADRQPRPLLVLFDGQNVFDDHGSFSGGWHAHEAVEKLGQKRLRPYIVGLDHGGTDRIDELSPYPTRWGSGRADALLQWIAHSLLPTLRGELPITEGAAGVLLGGSSMGGLASFYGHFRYPETFGGALAMSPSFWLGGRRLVDFVHGAGKPWISQLYLDSGAREGTALVEGMSHVLRSRGYDTHKLRVRIDKRGGHDERSWRRRLPNALRFFYK
jgi:enterochelin esterase-like enzyme